MSDVKIVAHCGPPEVDYAPCLWRNVKNALSLKTSSEPKLIPCSSLQNVTVRQLNKKFCFWFLALGLLHRAEPAKPKKQYFTHGESLKSTNSASFVHS
jgi:hypothetical protein